MNEPSVAPVQVGQILAGKYRIERVLGMGGMGVVVAALHVQLDERVAIKFLLPDALQSPETVARFAREARAAVKIKSEHIARVSDVGTLENGAPYMVMEYLEGRDLAAYLKERGALPIDEAVTYLLQAMEALAEAHGMGIVHRDLKPPNLFLTRRADGTAQVKVLDFGISKVTPRGGMNEASLTKTSSVMGSPLYMAPEQMVSTREVDARADVWALGVVLYELLAGHVPFLGESMTELCARILQEPPSPLRVTRPDVPPELEGLILRCLEKDRERRIGSVAELASGLVPFAPAYMMPSVERIARLSGATPGSYSAAALGATAYSQPAPAVGLANPPVMPAMAATPQPYTPAPYGTPMPGQPPANTQSSWGETRGSSGGGSGWLVVLGIGFLALFAGAVVGVAVLYLRPRAEATTLSTGTSTAMHASPAHAPTEADSPLEPLSTGTARVRPGATATVTATPSATATATASATATATPTMTATAPPTAKPTATKRPDIF